MLATLKTRRGRPSKVKVLPCIMFLLLLFSNSVLSSSVSKPGETIDIQFEQEKLFRYEQRIKRLVGTIQRVRGELELLASEHDSLEVTAQSLQESLQMLAEKHARVTPELFNDDQIDAGARQRHADFEVYLAERKYNRALKDLKEIQQQMSRKQEYLEDRINLLGRNKQGVVWQKQVLKKHQNSPSLQPILRPVTERLAQVR